MIPVSVYLQSDESDGQYRQLFQRMFHEAPAVGSFVRIYVADRLDVYVVKNVYHDFAMSPQGPVAQPVSIVVAVPEEDESENQSGEDVHTMEWGSAGGSIPRGRHV